MHAYQHFWTGTRSLLCHTHLFIPTSVFHSRSVQTLSLFSQYPNTLVGVSSSSGTSDSKLSSTSTIGTLTMGAVVVWGSHSWIYGGTSTLVTGMVVTGGTTVVGVTTIELRDPRSGVCVMVGNSVTISNTSSGGTCSAGALALGQKWVEAI